MRKGFIERDGLAVIYQGESTGVGHCGQARRPQFPPLRIEPRDTLAPAAGPQGEGLRQTPELVLRRRCPST